jgi:hypothetical protein
MVVKNLSSLVGCIFCAMALSLGSNFYGRANANGFGNPPGRGRAYAQHAVFQTLLNDIAGAKSGFQNGTNDLTAVPLTGTNNILSFINKNVWLITSRANQGSPFACWIEAQVTKVNYSSLTSYSQLGLTGGSYSGYWVAIQRASNANVPIYTDFPYGTNNSPAAAAGGNVEIIKSPTNSQWIVKVNGTVALTLNGYLCSQQVGSTNQLYYPIGGSQVIVGIETNDDSPVQTFLNGTKATGIQVKMGNGAYVTPLAGDVIKTDMNAFGWVSSYSNGQLTFIK